MGGIRAAVWTSPDGLAWARVPHHDGLFGGSASDERSMSGIVGIDAGLVAVGNGIWTSSDGFAWSRPVASIHGAVEDLGSVTALGLRLVAVGGVGDAPAVWIGLPPE
jgi:hypothetical protein